MKKCITAIGLVATFSGCAMGDAGQNELEAVGIAKQATVTSGRTVPYPIVRFVEDDGTSIETEIDPLTRKPRVAWDGSYMEMLVADELGKCVAEISGTGPESRHVDATGPYLGLGMPGMAQILASVDSGRCPRSEYQPSPNTYPLSAVEWALRRSDPTCNADSTGQRAAAIELPEPDDSSLVADFVAQHTAGSDKYATSRLRGFTCAPTTTPPCPDSSAFAWIYLAEVNLCLSGRLNSLLESAEIFTATTRDHLLTLGFAQESAQIALMKLGYLLKLQQKDDSDPPVNNYAGEAVGAYLRHWMDAPGDLPDKIRTKFLQALRLTGATSTTLAKYLERQAGARWTTTAGGSAFERDWDIGSARNRLLNLVYGGGTLSDLWGIEEWRGDMVPWFSEVKSHSPDPRLRVLFQLAREADALYFHPTVTGRDAVLDASSWESMYLETELGLRVRNCEKPDNTQCTKTALRPELPALTTPSAFRLQRDYGLTLEDAKRLANAFFEAAVRTDMVADPVAGEGWHAKLGAFHLSGYHSPGAPPGHDAETGWIHLDNETVLFPYGFDDRAQEGRSVCAARTPDWYVFDYCSDYRVHNVAQAPEDHGRLGVVPALAFAREVLFEQSGAINDPDVSQSVSSALTEIARLAGSMTAIRRQESVDLILPSPATTAGLPTLVNPAVSGDQPGLRTAAKDPLYESPGGVGRTLLDAADREPGAEVQGSGEAAGLTRVSWTAPNSYGWPGDSSLLLYREATDRPNYLFLTETRAAEPVLYNEPTSTITEDGWFAELVAKVTAVSATDWSKPKYDGFGLPTNWVPPADASLMGGNAGEESYQYLLRNAKAAAEEATSAVKTAIDRLSEEARDAAALAQAETKAQAIGQMENKALCGGTLQCYLPMGTISLSGVSGDPCAVIAETTLRSQCDTPLARYASMLPTRSIPQVVIDRLDGSDGGFSDTTYAGSELQKVLVRIWNAAKLIGGAKDQGVRLAVAAGREAEAVNSALVTAQNDYNTAQDALTLLVNASIGPGGVGASEGPINAANEMVGRRAKLLAAYCMPFAGRCYPVPDGVHFRRTCEAGVDESLVNAESLAGCLTGECDYEGHLAGDKQACSRAATDYLDAVTQRDLAVWESQTTLLGLDWQPGTNLDLLAEVAEARAEASARMKAAEDQLATRLSQVEVQTGSHLAILQQTIGELNSALADLRQLQLRAGFNNARASLDSSLAEDAYDTNANLRRRFRSYDLWRARALLESARRLALTARRSIESRFVVDLSRLDSEQAFVASPSTWADEVFESDLNAPEVVGLSQAPKIEGAIYPNKLHDYVGNLERFVQGYTMTYPTSVSLPDTEVITLGGPDQATAANRAGLVSLSPDSKGWRFYCPDQNTWIAHNGIASYPLENRLRTACGGKAPSHAKIGFWLDPWGTLNGSPSHPAYADRHNVRWRRLAVNLVGTGIRDCSRATDSMSCYTNPYVRFNLVHAGSSWQTNYSGEWRALDIPTAHIEAGKALAAEEWIEPISNSWNMPYVANVARGELFGRPAAGNYELVLEVTPDVRLDRIERVQLLVEQDYWVKQNGGQGVYKNTAPTGAAGAPSAGGASGSGGSTGSGGTTGSGGSSQGGAGGSTGDGLVGSCTPVGNDPTIETFEDGDKVLATAEQRLGIWFGFHAGTCTVSPPNNDSFVPLSPGDASNFAGYTSGSGCDAGSWQGGGIGFSLLSSYVNNTATVCDNYNASKYTGLAFRAQGSGTVRLEVCTSDLVDENCHGYNFNPTTSWATYSAHWSQMAQNSSWGVQVGALNPAHLRKVQFVSNTANYSFAVDNIAFTTN